MSDQIPYILRVPCQACGSDVGVPCRDVESLSSSHARRWNDVNRKRVTFESLVEVDGETERAVHTKVQNGCYRIVRTGRIVDVNSVRWVGWGETR